MAREEYQYIPYAVAGMYLEEGAQSCLHKVWLTGQGVKYVYIVLSSLNVDWFGTRGILSIVTYMKLERMDVLVKEIAEPPRVQCGTHNNYF